MRIILTSLAIVAASVGAAQADKPKSDGLGLVTASDASGGGVPFDDNTTPAEPVSGVNEGVGLITVASTPAPEG